MIRLRMIVVGAAIAVLPGLVWAQKFGESGTVHVEFDHDVDFSKYKTYAWAPFQDPAPNPANHIRITQAVERELEDKGFTKVAPAEAALYVRYQGKLEKKFRGTPTQEDSPWQPNNKQTIVNFDRVKVGTLVLELWDTSTKDVVWQARETMPAPSPDRMEAAISKSVKRLMLEYPPKAEAKPE
jgi:hypothetical protein